MERYGMDAFSAILTRRSTRKYSQRLPKKQLIDQVIEAGRYAPSGSNSQTTHLLVFTVLIEIFFLQFKTFLLVDYFTHEYYGRIISASVMLTPRLYRHFCYLDVCGFQF
jgi:hypothetical protein